MPRLRPEWLLVPLFLLPPAGFLAFLAYARADHAAAVARAQAGEDPGFEVGDAVGRFLRDVRFASEPDDVEVDWAGAPARVRTARPVPRAWRFTARFPGGVGVAGLADDDVRIEVERGTPPADLAPADAPARAFRDLYARPHVAQLAAAPLPLETKRFLAERVPDGADVRAFLATLHEAGPPGPLAPGVHGAWLVGRDAPLLWPARRLPQYEWPAPRGHVTLRYGAEGGTPWPGRTPLAGRWSVASVHGHRWWRDAFFRRWVGPAVLTAAGLLLFPALLWLAIRRQRQLDRARVRFVTEIAHDLRTPLTALRLHAELLERDRPGARAERIATEATRLSHLLSNLLDLTRLERGSRVFEPEPLALPELVDEAARDFRALHADRADDLSVEGPPLSVRADRAALRRCLDNLLDNAGKHTAKGTPVRVTWTGGNGRVQVDVADEGDGIDPAEQSRLFARYHRGARARDAAVPGTGLGLALVRELARGMGGEAKLVPSSKGACFRLELEASA